MEKIENTAIIKYLGFYPFVYKIYIYTYLNTYIHIILLLWGSRDIDCIDFLLL